MVDRVLSLALFLSLLLHLLLVVAPLPVDWGRDVHASRIDVELRELPPPEPPAKPAPLAEILPQLPPSEPGEVKPAPPSPETSQIGLAPRPAPLPAAQLTPWAERAKELSFGPRILQPSVRLDLPTSAIDAADLFREEARAAAASTKQELERLLQTLQPSGVLEGTKLTARLTIKEMERPPLPPDERIGFPLQPQPPSEAVAEPLPVPLAAMESIKGPASKRYGVSKPGKPPQVQLEASSSVELKFWVRADGTVGRVVPLKRGATALEEAGMNYFRQWRFNPLANGEEELQWGIITIRYELQ